MSLTEKQLAAWQRPHVYQGRGYKVEIANGRAKGSFNSLDGEHVSKFDFQYSPIEAIARDPNWRLKTYTSYEEQPPAHGWLTIGSGDIFETIAVPQFAHPDSLYQWLREEFGYERTVMLKG